MGQTAEGMLFGFDLPRFDEDALPLSMKSGDIIFVLGANGTGKSALIQSMSRASGGEALRIAAHRQTWLPSSTLNMTAQGMRENESQIRSADTRPRSRWQGTDGDPRPGMAIYKLINSEIPRLRQLRDAARTRDAERVWELADEESPLEQINNLLRASNLPVVVSIENDDEVRANRARHESYPMAEMSDGERSAVLIATDVLTAPSKKLFLIDEPERHLHRSIITPLLSSLISARSDCAFVIATHELGLPLDFPESKALLLRECHFADGSAMTWTADLLEPPHAFHEQLQRDILGARRKILFVEGRTSGSLDQPLYALLFPGFSIVPKGGQGDVIRSVKGLRGASNLVWVEAFGIVDRDNRSDGEVATLREEGVFALDWYSVESIYYHPELQARVAKRLTGNDGGAPLDEARDGAIHAVKQQADHLVRKRTLEAARRRAQDSVPTEFALDSVLELPSVDVPGLSEVERTRLEDAIEGKDLATIVERYPIREAGALGAIAKGLGFRSAPAYERAALALLSDDADSLEWVKSRFEPLTSAVAESDNLSPSVSPEEDA